jgi:hypothetical protein
MTIGRFVPLAAVTTAVVSSTLLMLVPACKSEGTSDCGEACAFVGGGYPLEFQGDAGLPAECLNLNVAEVPDGSVLALAQQDGGILTGTLTDIPLTGQVYASGDLSLSGGPPPSTDGGVTSFVNLTAIFTGGANDAGSLTGTFTGNYSRTQGTASLRCTVVRPFTATRR